MRSVDRTTRGQPHRRLLLRLLPLSSPLSSPCCAWACSPYSRRPHSSHHRRRLRASACAESWMGCEGCACVGGVCECGRVCAGTRALAGWLCLLLGALSSLSLRRLPSSRQRPSRQPRPPPPAKPVATLIRCRHRSPPPSSAAGVVWPGPAPDPKSAGQRGGGRVHTLRWSRGQPDTIAHRPPPESPPPPAFPATDLARLLSGNDGRDRII